MKLYDLVLSGNCYKVRLFAALAHVPLEIVPVDFLAGEHKRSPLIDLNPWGELPILVDGEVVLRDSQAILVYLAQKYAAPQWLPRDAAGLAAVVQWLSTAANEVQNGPASARLVDSSAMRSTRPTPCAAARASCRCSKPIWASTPGWPPRSPPSPIARSSPMWRWRPRAGSTWNPGRRSGPGSSGSRPCRISCPCPGSEPPRPTPPNPPSDRRRTQRRLARQALGV